MRKPRLTEKVLSGLMDALSRQEADDLSDQSNEESAALHAALAWIEQMYTWRAEQEENRRAKEVFRNGGVFRR